MKDAAVAVRKGDVTVVPSQQKNTSNCPINETSVAMATVQVVMGPKGKPIHRKSKRQKQTPARSSQKDILSNSPNTVALSRKTDVTNTLTSTPKYLLKKTSPQPRFLLQASAAEFVPQMASSQGSSVNPLGISAWPSLPQSTAAPEKALAQPRRFKGPSPVVAKISPPSGTLVESVQLSRISETKVGSAINDTSAKGQSTVPLIRATSATTKTVIEPPPLPVNAEGSHFDLLRLYQEGKLTTQKGRQRFTPQKKKFTSLKKKVLDERLRQWKALQGISDEVVTDSGNDTTEAPFSTLCVYGFCTGEELSDDDEYEEILDNLNAMASKIGVAKRCFVPRQGAYDEDHWPVFVQFEDSVETPAATFAAAALQCWKGLILGGQTLSCRPMPNLVAGEGASSDDETSWQNACLTVEASWSIASKCVEVVADTVTSTTIILANALTEEDLDDEDCLAESLSDIRLMALKYGDVESIQLVVESNMPTTQLLIIYKGDARKVVAELNKVVIGGQQLVAALKSPSTNSSQQSICIRLRNVLTDDDLVDESCLEESLNDVRELAMQFGHVQNVDVEKPMDEGNWLNASEYFILLFFATVSDAKSAAAGFNGMVIGGSTVVSEFVDRNLDGFEGDVLMDDDPTKMNTLQPMYSGDKLISERFAECKRAPKTAGHGSARPYAKLAGDETIKTTIIEMLSELTRLQRRAIEENNVKAKRRLVLGLREVARGIRSHKVKLVVMANNLDEYGVIDATVQSIIDLAQNEDVPIYYELSKKALGKAVGKTIKVAVVGVQSPEGAHQQYKKLMNYASTFGLS